jgi:hypothetical protein
MSKRGRSHSDRITVVNPNQFVHSIEVGNKRFLEYDFDVILIFDLSRTAMGLTEVFSSQAASPNVDMVGAGMLLPSSELGATCVILL